MAGPIVDVEGLRELNRAFARAGREVRDNKRSTLEAAARPVARGAEGLALGRIRNMPRSPEWSLMRIGSNRDYVYVAPVKRGSKIPAKKRRKFARMLITEAMQPAVDLNRDQVTKRIDELLARMQRAWERS